MKSKRGGCGERIHIRKRATGANYPQSQKIELIGRFAGGVVHDFNNLLTAIIGYQCMLVENLEDEKTRHYASQVITLAEKGVNLTEELLNFMRDQPAATKLVDLNLIIRQAENLVKRLVGENIEIRTNIYESHLPIKAVPIQIEQILMNLAMNARDAMANGGIFTLSTGIENDGGISGKLQRRHKSVTYAVLSVSDTGMGMEQEVSKRIFEPFFTTKGIGKGTGLGLSFVERIIRGHGGHIKVLTRPGIGSTFSIYLPIAEMRSAGISPIL